MKSYKTGGLGPNKWGRRRSVFLILPDSTAFGSFMLIRWYFPGLLGVYTILDMEQAALCSIVLHPHVYVCTHTHIYINKMHFMCWNLCRSRWAPNHKKKKLWPFWVKPSSPKLFSQGAALFSGMKLCSQNDIQHYILIISFLSSPGAWQEMIVPTMVISNGCAAGS